MYKSPIDVLLADIQHQIAKQQDGEIYKAVVSVGINVDKEELIRALRYDRDQYEKGYADGQADALRWIPVTERLPDTQDYDWVLAQITLKPECIYGVPVVAELRADGWYDAYDNMIDGKYEKVTHWMPLPEPPKEGADNG